ncbi:MAG TPA: DUF2845 domain-containing protein [Polyangiaceae bacterium]|nr:DUF2845 domain-containing protein [Polyangiaceae bacterium]
MRSKVLKQAMLTAAAACLLFVGNAQADSLSCKNRIVSSGDSTYQVRSVCGEPDATTRRIEVRTVRHSVPVPCQGGQRCWRTVERTIDVTIEEWTYDFGRQRFIQYLTFEDGRLDRVQSGSYGHKLASLSAAHPRE